MRNYRVILAEACLPVAWKNGGGTTREIATYPPGSPIESFLWRLSTAQVEAPGDFSCFEGVDRTIAILSGKLEMTVAGHDPVVLGTVTEPYHFAGDARTIAAPIGGAVVDLNLMVRRGAFSGDVQPVSEGKISLSARYAFIFALSPCCLNIDDDIVHLQKHDAVMFEEPADCLVVLDQPAFLIRVDDDSCMA